jgi:hypothetical protein
VGDTPNSVVYNDGTQDLLAWVPGASEAGAPAGGGAPEGAGVSTEIISGAPTDGGGVVTGGDDVAPAVIPAPEEVNPYETPEQHDRSR